MGDVSKIEIKEEKTEYKVLKEKDKINFDIILYSGEEKSVNFNQLEKAICAFGFNISTKKEVFSKIVSEENQEMLISSWEAGGASLKVESNIKAMPFTTLTLNDKQYINGELLENLTGSEIG